MIAKDKAEKFVAYWSAQNGSERSRCHQFWDSLLGEVLGVSDLKRFIEYEKPVFFNDGTTKSLDAWIPSTKVLIEHKSSGIDLDAPLTHHRGQTPFQQAWDYDNNRPLSEKARWIVVCNFDEMRIHDMEVDRTETSFQRIALADLPKECHRLVFLVQSADAIRAKELEVSVKAGRVVGKLYNAFLEQCGESAKDPEVLKNLNKLCVRLVFCVYAEDAGVFAKDQFLDFLRKFHFSSTNSIAQGSQVPILWSVLLNEHHVTIDYAHRTFKWDSEATDKAAVFCVIVGFSVDPTPRKKLLFTDGIRQGADNISPYLVPGPNDFVVAEKETLCDVPKMNFGNQPRDGGFLILSEEERVAALAKEPELEKWIRPYVGAEEFINAKKRYCLWLKKATPLEIARSEFLSARVAAVREFRLASKAKTTNGYAKVSHLFAQLTQPDDVDYLIIPRVSSERRRYIPIGYETGDIISSDAVQIVPNATLYHFGVLTSKVHMAWMRTVCGRLKSDYRYSKEIVYNPFPWPDVKLGQTGCDNADFLCGEPVARLTGHEFEGVRGGRAIVGEIYDSYARVNWLVRHPEIGEIRLTKSGINDSIRHGFGRFKLAAFDKIPEIISNGKVVLHSPNWKGRGYESFVVAAPISIGGDPYCAFVVINSVKEGGHRFYLHEVGRLADIKEKSGGLRSGSSDCSALSSTPGSIKSLAFSIFAVKGVKNLNSKAEIERTAQAILDARQKYTGASFAELYGEKMYLFTDLVAAHAANDAAVLKAYGWPTDLSEPEIVSRLFDMYEKLTAGDNRSPLGCR